MKGKTGREKVLIYEIGGKKLASAVLPKHGRKFTFKYVDSVRINYAVDNGDVILQNPKSFTIQYIDGPLSWKCHTASGNKRCKYIARGDFQWRGNYLITNKHAGMIMILVKNVF